MSDTGVIGTLLLIFTGLATYKGFRDYNFFEENCFEVDSILIDKSYKRLLTSGFLHSGWLHFGLNMVVLLSFSWSLELVFGYWKLLFIYLASLVAGNLLALFIHRQHGDYRAVGASGAVSGVIFSSILLFPEAPIKFFLIPIEFKSWLLGLIFMMVTIFAIKKKKGNIGHEAHLGGAIAGILISLFFLPFDAINWWVVAILLVPTLAFLLLIVNNPAVLMVENYWGDHIGRLQQAARQPREPVYTDTQTELDTLLDKIRLQGMDSLTKTELERLEKLKNEL